MENENVKKESLGAGVFFVGFALGFIIAVILWAFSLQLGRLHPLDAKEETFTSSEELAITEIVRDEIERVESITSCYERGGHISHSLAGWRDNGCSKGNIRHNWNGSEWVNEIEVPMK